MQEDANTLYKTIGNLVNKIRKEKGIKYTVFCYENDIPKTTYNNIVNARSKITFYNLAKVIKALGLTFEEFGAMLDKELSDDFLNLDKD